MAFNAPKSHCYPTFFCRGHGYSRPAPNGSPRVLQPRDGASFDHRQGDLQHLRRQQDPGRGHRPQRYKSLPVHIKERSERVNGVNLLHFAGIHSRSDIGLLSLFEHYGSIVVGDNLKTPAFPVWLVCSESHFTVLFGLSLGLERTSLADRRPVDLYYYDQLSRLTDKPVKFTIDCTNARNRKFMGGGGSKHVLASTGSEDEYLVSPIEHCLRTKWRDAHVGWNGSEPIL